MTRPQEPQMHTSATKRLWDTLEQNQPPQARDVIYLSSLQEKHIQQLTALWPNLAYKIRSQLIEQLTLSTEADFEMDYSAVFRIALQDTDAQIRTATLEGLYGNNNIRLVTKFIKMLHNDPAISVRTKAAQALGHFVLQGELEKIPTRTFERTRKALLQTYHDQQEDIEVRRRTLESLAYTNLDDIPDLISTAYTHPDTDFRISAVFAMGRSADPRWEHPILQELHNPNPAMRFEATRACGELELRVAVSTLIELTEDIDNEIQQMALWSLGQIGGDLARATLTRFISGTNKSLQPIAQQALDELDFFHGNLDKFFGPPNTFDGGTDLSWEQDKLSHATFAEDNTDAEEPELW